MSDRFLVFIGALALSLAAPLVGQAPAKAALAAKTKSAAIPRTPDGHPDLQGVWTNATLTPMERPAKFAGKATVSDAEANAYEKSDLESNDIDNPTAPLLKAAGSESTGGYNNLFIDRGSELARVDGVKRTGLIIDPPDGKIPFKGERSMRRGDYGAEKYDDIKERPLSERCILGFGWTAGPPMMPVLYNNNYQIVQTPTSIMILVEMVHDVRVIRMNGKHAPSNIRQWFGDSIGHWEGDTLVVDTTNFTGQTRFAGASENLHVVERFQRVDTGTILYRATVDDPTTFSKPFTLEYPFLATKGPVFEYACHEGNYAMPDIMGGARKLEKEGRENISRD